MAKKNDKGEPVGWVTVKGKHFPKWADGTIGWQDGVEEPEKTSGKKETGKVDKKETSVSSLGNELRQKKSVGIKDAKNYMDQEGSELHVNYRNYSGNVSAYMSNKNDKGEGISVSGKNIDQLTQHLKDSGYERRRGSSEYEYIYSKAKSSTPKKATKELGNGLRLTSDVSDPYKNYSEVERAKKVNREKQYADKKLNQYRKAAQEEKAKAQSIADAISAKTGIPNTTSRNARYDTGRAVKKVKTETEARRQSAAEDTRSRKSYFDKVKNGKFTKEDYGNLNSTQIHKLSASELRAIGKKLGLSDFDVSGTKQDIINTIDKKIFGRGKRN